MLFIKGVANQTIIGDSVSVLINSRNLVYVEKDKVSTVLRMYLTSGNPWLFHFESEKLRNEAFELLGQTLGSSAYKLINLIAEGNIPQPELDGGVV